MCEKVIIDKQGAHSLINIMNNASIKLQETPPGEQPRDVPIPNEAVIPTQWWIYTQWEPSSNDVGQPFKQVYEIYWPNGEKLVTPRGKLELQFVQGNDKTQQTTFYIGGFPVGQEGKLKIVTWLESPEGAVLTAKVENDIRIEHLQGNSEPNVAPQFSTHVTRSQ